MALNRNTAGAQKTEYSHRFYPLELAALVHEEPSYLAKALRSDAIEAGDNIVIDAVLSDADKAVALGSQLAEAGYEVWVIDVEVSRQGKGSWPRY